jgi:two-component system, NtrC family, nitrogen regulation sensor histidine kinase NtrY
MKAQPRTVKLVIAGVSLLILILLVFAQQAFNLKALLNLNPTDPGDIVVSSALSALVFMVTLVFGFVLLRTVVKVWMERRQQKPGAKFKTGLLIRLVALTLIPAICVFAYSYGLLNRSIDKWFNAPIEEIFNATDRNNQQWHREHESWARSILMHLGSESDLPSDLEPPRTVFRLNALMVIDPDGEIDRIATAKGLATDTIGRDVLDAIGSDDEVFKNLKSGWLAAIRIQSPSGPKVLAAIFPPLNEIARSNINIADQKNNYEALARERKNFRDTYIYLLALITVLVMFAAVSLGLYLSRRITIPIEALAVATREISAGNLSHRVTIKADDELGLLITLFNDMADRLNTTSRELQNRRRYMEVILESIPTGVISIDGEGQVHTLNRAARTMFSVESAESLSDIFKGPDLREINALINDVQEIAISREINFVTPGRPGHSAVTAGRLATGGTVLVVEDLTEVVRAQRASAWREVARRLAHEIKNPLTPILLSAERITRNIERLPAATPRVTGVIRECVDLIVDEVSSLRNLVDEFVRFARLPTVARFPNSIRELVDKTLALYEGRMEGVAVTVELPEDLPLVLIDPMQMKRVLINLIDNALDALSDQTDKALSITADLARDGTMVRVTIDDTGRGITAEDRERLFTPYFSTRKDGTGLGLSIVSRIIADHGGYIGAEPNPPRGTRFVIELPVCLESSLLTTNRASANR